MTACYLVLNPTIPDVSLTRRSEQRMKQADEQETATNKQVQQERTRLAGILKEERRDRQGRLLLRRLSDP